MVRSPCQFFERKCYPQRGLAEEVQKSRIRLILDGVQWLEKERKSSIAWRRYSSWSTVFKNPLLTQKKETSCGMIDPFVLLYLSRIEYDDAPYLCVPHTFRARNAI